LYDELAMTRIIIIVFGCLVGAGGSQPVPTTPQTPLATSGRSGDGQMQLGNFSISLAVKDIAASRAFYEKLGFKQIAGNQAQNWLILQNSTSTIGLFQGPQFTRNMLTFNPGWDRTGGTLPDFDDVRDIQRTLKSRGLVPTAAADESSTGPASMVLTDPDGNPILIDQHVPKPGK
jgi:catechol 2,3-dioxygenase-like lactoylglutathione lyase family enzyme